MSDERRHLEEPKAVFEGGATRSVKLERYDLIPPEAEECEAARFGLGAIKHGEENWKKGDARFIRETINHCKAHVNSLMQHGPFHKDDDIGAARCNLAMLAWFREHKPNEFLEALGMQQRRSDAQPIGERLEATPRAARSGGNAHRRRAPRRVAQSRTRRNRGR